MVITRYDDYLLEQLLNESMMNEKINMDKIKSIVKQIGDKKEAIKKLIKKFNGSKNLNAKKYLSYLIVALIIGNFSLNNNKWKTSHEYNKHIEQAALSLIDVADKNDELTMDDINEIEVDAISGADDWVPYEIMSASQLGFIDAVNDVKPGRLDSAKVDRYDMYDADILKACEELRRKGETPNPNFIKTIMLIETGMNPRKNHLGFEGFPQTKIEYINGWKDKNGKFHPGINQKHGTNFTMADMYDAGESAKFIHYYLKSLQKSTHVNSPEDMLIAYNWGMGNLGKYKKGVKKLPQQSADYVDMYNAMTPYYAGT
jgi:hypothetical protein